MNKFQSYDAEILKKLFSTNLDKKLLQTIANAEVQIFESKLYFPQNLKNENQKNLLIRIENYMESGIVLSEIKDVHLQNFQVDFHTKKCDNFNSIKLSQIGEYLL